MKIYRPLVLDFSKKNYNNTVLASQFDTLSRYVDITLIDNSVPVDITNHTVRIYAKKPDGTKVFNDVEIIDATNGKVRVELTNQILAVMGLVECELTLYGTDGSIIASQKFYINVDKTLRDDSAIESTNEFTALTNVLNDIEQAKADVGVVGSLNTELENNIATGTTLKQDLDTYISTGSKLKADLETDITTATQKKTELENNIATGTTLKQDLDTYISNGSQLKADLETDITTATQKKTELENVIATADTTTYATKEEITTINFQLVDIMQQINAVGVKWTYGSSTSMTRLGAAVGKNPGADFDKIFPYSQMKLCNVRDDGTISAFLGDPTYARDGSNGEVMVYIPKFYYKHTYNNTTKEHELWISPFPGKDFKLHPAFIRAGVEKPYILVGAYKAGIDVNNKITSRSGIIPLTGVTRANFRTYAQNRGAKWWIVDAFVRSKIGLLFLIEYATTDTQTAIGKGVTELPYSTSHTVIEATTNANTIIVSPATGVNFFVGQIIGVGTSLGGNQVCKEREILSIDTSNPTKTVITVNGAPFSTAVGNIVYSNAQKTGKCDNLNGISGMATGTNGKVSISYRGLEDIWGNTWEMIDGINIKNSEKQPYFADSSFSDDKFDTTYKPSGIILPDSNGYVKNFGYSQMADWLLIPSEIGGSSSTYIPDYFYQNWAAASEKIALAGGDWRSGGSAGFFCWHVSDSSGDASLRVGARALLIP